MLKSLEGTAGKGSMKLKTLKIAAIGTFCAAAAAANMLHSEGKLPDIPESVVFFDVPAITDTFEEGLININTAPMEQLVLLPGIGEVRARAIIEYRESYGGFVSIEEITEVRGIGSVTYENIKGLITTGS